MSINHIYFMKPFIHEQLSQSALQIPSLKSQRASKADAEAQMSLIYLLYSEPDLEIYLHWYLCDARVFLPYPQSVGDLHGPHQADRLWAVQGGPDEHDH